MYQDKTGIWYQVVDKQNQAGNYSESSGSKMVAYTILKEVCIDFLPKRYQ